MSVHELVHELSNAVYFLWELNMIGNHAINYFFRISWTFEDTKNGGLAHAKTGTTLIILFFSFVACVPFREWITKEHYNY